MVQVQFDKKCDWEIEKIMELKKEEPSKIATKKRNKYRFFFLDQVKPCILYAPMF